MLRKYFRKADFILLATLIALGVAFSVVLSMWKSDGAMVVVKTDGEIFGTYPLSEDALIEIKVGDGSNTLVIEDGTARISDATCKNHVCVRHAAISKSGESIICLPNKLIVTIEGAEEGDDIDAVSS